MLLIMDMQIIDSCRTTCSPSCIHIRFALVCVVLLSNNILFLYIIPSMRCPCGVIRYFTSNMFYIRIGLKDFSNNYCVIYLRLCGCLENTRQSSLYSLWGTLITARLNKSNCALWLLNVIMFFNPKQTLNTWMAPCYKIYGMKWFTTMSYARMWKAAKSWF